MESMECCLDPCTHIFIDNWGLRKVAKVEKCTDCNDKFRRYHTSNNWQYITLDIAVFPSSNLLQHRDPFLEVPKCRMRVKNGKAKIDFSSTNSIYTPFCIVIPKLFMPVVKQLWC